MGLTLGHGAWQIDWPSNGSMWNSYSFQPVGQWMGYSFTDLGAEGCCRSLNALFTMFPSSYHHEIFRNYYNGQKWCPCKRSRAKVKVTEVNTQLSRFRTLTPVWIHIWQWNHAHSWKQHRRGGLLFFKVIREISRSHGSKNRRTWPKLGVSGLYLQFEFTNGYEMIHKAWSSTEEVPYC